MRIWAIFASATSTTIWFLEASAKIEDEVAEVTALPAVVGGDKGARIGKFSGDNPAKGCPNYHIVEIGSDNLYRPLIRCYLGAGLLNVFRS